MSSENPQTPDVNAQALEVNKVAIENQIQESYIDYAMSVIVSRALPDVRDGMKPVHRRILYKMNELGLTNNKSHRKSSSVVGETMGDLHPHGDKAIYDALVRMAQDFSMWGPLVDGQGNFGSMDGDPPAAKRYTEARMSELGETMLTDLNKNTVDYRPNYDNRLEEPEVLPASFPNILVNGSSGIAVGMTTSIPPHNLTEVINATIYRIQNPDCSIDELMEHLPGPDFPTGANIVGREGIKTAYKTGNGRITVRANYEVQKDNNRIVVTEIPYQQRKDSLVQDIAEVANSDELSGIKGVRDESDREGVRIVIDVKSTANIDIIENRLIESCFEKTISMNHIALSDGQPQRMSLDTILDKYIEHRREVIRRKSQYDKEEKEDRLHIIEGRLKALNNIDDIVEIIRESENTKSAIQTIKNNYGLTEEQAKHITRMRLSSLTSLKRDELHDEKEKLTQEVRNLNSILNNSNVLDDELIVELENIEKEHGRDRKTRIIDDYNSVDDEDLIPEEDIIVTVTENNYVKRMNINKFRIQQRNGKGIIGFKGRDDTLSDISKINTHDRLLMFTDKGDVHELKGYEIPESTRQAHGTNAVNLLDIEKDEKIKSVVTVKDGQNTNDNYVTISTKNGLVKRTSLDEFNNIWEPGIKAITLENDDQIVNVSITDGANEIMLASKNGKVIRFEESEVRDTGRSSKGVQGINLEKNDQVVSMATCSSEDELLTITKKGIGKRSDVDDYSLQSRKGKGTKGVREIDKTGEISDICTVKDNNKNAIIASCEGNIIRVDLSSISKYSRISNGLKVMNIEDDDYVVSSSIE